MLILSGAVAVQIHINLSYRSCAESSASARGYASHRACKLRHLSKPGNYRIGRQDPEAEPLIQNIFDLALQESPAEFAHVNPLNYTLPIDKYGRGESDSAKA